MGAKREITERKDHMQALKRSWIASRMIESTVGFESSGNRSRF